MSERENSIIVDGKGTWAEVSKTPISSSPEVDDRLLKENKPFNIDQFADELGLGVEVVKEAIDGLRRKGYNFENSGETYVRGKSARGGNVYDATRRFDGQHFLFGIVSDKHYCDKQTNEEAVERMYDTFEKEGITTVFDCGDLTAGWKVYHGQEMELTHFGQDEQIDYVIKSHPRRKGITTFAISGNHDLKEYERGGADPLVQIEHCRDDIVYLGQLSANVKLTEGVTLEMLHPGGTYPYALSYKAQRDINNRQPNQLPDILAYGHYHGAFYMYYRGIHFIQAPTFKNQGLWERRMGLNPVVGGWVVEAAVYGDRIGWFKPQLHTFDRKG